MTTEVFERYAAYYDLLYRDKDYAAEAEYVIRLLCDTAPKTRTLLEFGSGTGRHGRLLAGRGFDVFGIERSTPMVMAARAAIPAKGSGSFDCEQGDLGTIKLGRRFDAVIALFHVMSYQVSDEGIRRAVGNAAEHLNPGGVFLFDVWHGPAVLKQPPEIRTKRVADANTKLTRTASPELRPEEHTVVVRYSIVAESIRDHSAETFHEEHSMRYFFPDEIESIAQDAGFRIERCEEFLTGHPASEETWGVCYLLRKNS